MNKNEKSAEKILQLLKEQGEMTAKQLSEKLKMTTMGVRQHLQSLEESGELAFFDQKALRGRPTRFWQLTEKANDHFENRHEELSVQLIISVREVFGEQGLDKLINQREKQTLALYQQAVLPLPTIDERLQALVKLRSEEGYMASFEVQQGCYWLFENHCPICAAATECLSFCRSELNIFQLLFEDLATVTREDHIVEGARRCAYKVVEK
ncbi:transcriptional regulator [Psychromonas sp. psych-6C06]|uniref:helix-turn-helix transcriptional regulator n=1 Tax=Psychromonas sp. psych-6C06 TaxID=2058089 RepID=UPI000C347ED5|nr:metalloregulator ArsR/SmtB family transcription factor [Psychromonas sp. psych-6C06]PKF63294.1 transcriptional regulator [Psychromonas sp. psych-6C06]